MLSLFRWSVRLAALSIATGSVTSADDVVQIFSSPNERPLFTLRDDGNPSQKTDSESTISTPEVGFSRDVAEESESFGATRVGLPSLFSGDAGERKGRLLFDAELLFLRFNSLEGTRGSVFDFDTAVRYTLGYVSANGLGFRTVYFEYDDQANDVGGVGRVLFDTYNLDFEVLKQIQLTKSTELEFSGGLRYNETDFFRNTPADFSNFHGIGVLLGAKSSTRIFTGGSVYGRARFSILSGNGSHDGNAAALRNAHLTGRDQTELGVGYEHPIQLGAFEVTPRLGAELQNWGGYGIDPVDEHPDTDLFLAGFLLGLDVRY